MENSKYIALLRGINVGGNTLIKMPELKACFESLGFTDVVTYIQSGNVVFSVDNNNNEKITQLIESGLKKRFGFDLRIALINSSQIKDVVENAPKDFGKFPELYRYDVIFFISPAISEEAIKEISLREGVDTAVSANGVLYFSRLISEAGKSYLNKIIKSKHYKKMTIRNWNTTSKLNILAN